MQVLPGHYTAIAVCNSSAVSQGLHHGVDVGVAVAVLVGDGVAVTVGEGGMVVDVNVGVGGCEL